jgi:hypothetical protein
LAEALTVHKTLRKIMLSLDPEYPGHQVQAGDNLSAHTYDAVCAMLRVDTNLVLALPLFTSGGERLSDSRNRMRIEHVLNLVGRGRLISSSQTTRKGVGGHPAYVEMSTRVPNLASAACTACSD